jgi:hypothetical protein
MRQSNHGGHKSRQSDITRGGNPRAVNAWRIGAMDEASQRHLPLVDERRQWGIFCRKIQSHIAMRKLVKRLALDSDPSHWEKNWD